MAIRPIGLGRRLSQAVAHGDTISLAGQVAETAAGGSVAGQTREILARIERLLVEAGSDKSKLLTANIRLSDMDTFAEMNAVWDSWVVEGHTPGRTTVEAEPSSLAHAVEIAVVAAR